MKPRHEIDMRQFASATGRQLVKWAIVLIVGVGLALIGLLYGTGAVEFAGLVFLLMLLPVLAVIGILWLLGWIAKKARSE
ncbi:MAG: hypothetical protein ABSF61_09245 [Anaerolineales bacterium]